VRKTGGTGNGATRGHTADDIEHDDAITNRILDEIESSEFLFAHMIGERM
jgi:hypothetical protein